MLAMAALKATNSISIANTLKWVMAAAHPDSI
jgi:hypothetical protein